MTNYLIRRLFLIPITLFAIVLVNFVILNLAPGDPVTATEMSQTGEASRKADAETTMSETQYLQFREHYGLTLPILFNLWPSLSEEKIKKDLTRLATRKKEPGDLEELKASEYNHLYTLWGDRARFVMPLLLKEAQNEGYSLKTRQLAANLFIRGGLRQGKIGPSLTEEERAFNKKIASDNQLLLSLRIRSIDSREELDKKVAQLANFLNENEALFPYPLSWKEKVKLFFFETRFCRYLTRVLFLDFGSLRNDQNKLVISEVAKRMKYSLTLAVLPMLVTFILCQCFGMWMALKQNQWQDVTLNTFFLILFAIPIFVVAPFLIEKVAMGHTLPFTSIPIPTSGFHSPEEVYSTLTSNQRLADVALHIFLPLTAVIYGTLAIQSRLSRTAILEVLRQNFVKVAKAKGLPPSVILIKHVGRNASITIVTALATSLGIVLSGSLIVETVFEINGFGRFFYEAILNRDYNVMLFSVFASSLLTLIGYLIADIAYTLLDPRVSLE